MVVRAREAGRDLSLDDVEVENLVPESLRGIDRELFITRLAELDAPMRARLDAANIRNLGLRYVARLARDGKAHVGLVALPAEDACLHTRLTDNMVKFPRSERRSVGKECVSKCRSRCEQNHEKNKR